MEPDRVDAEEASFAKLWSKPVDHLLVMDVPKAIRDDLMRFLPEGLPERLKDDDKPPEEPEHPTPAPAPPPPPSTSEAACGHSSRRPRTWSQAAPGSARRPRRSRPGPTRYGHSTGCTGGGHPNFSSRTRSGSGRPSRRDSCSARPGSPARRSGSSSSLPRRSSASGRSSFGRSST